MKRALCLCALLLTASAFPQADEIATAILTNGGIVVSGNPVVRGAHGGMHANGNLTISGNPTVERDATCVGTLTVSGNPTVGGLLSGGRPAVPVPVIDPENYRPHADYILKPDGRVTDRTGNLVFDGSGGAVFNGWKFAGSSGWQHESNILSPAATYFFETDVKIGDSPGSELVPVQMTVIATGSIEVSGSPRMKRHLPDIGLVAGGDLKISGTFPALLPGLFAAHEQVQISSAAVITGAIVAENAGNVSSLVQGPGIEINGNPTITYEGGIRTLLTLAAPTNLSGTPLSPTSIRWTWTDASANESGFRLKDAAGNITVDNIAANSTSHDEAGLPPNAEVARRVFAFNASGESGPSNLATASTLLADPTAADFTLAAIRWNLVEIRVTPPPNSTDGQTGVRVERSRDGGLSWQIVQDFAAIYVVQDSGLAQNSTFYYRVAFRNRAGVVTAFSPAQSVETPALPPPVIAAPANGALLNTARPTVSGSSALEGLTITLFVDGSANGTTTSGANGAWSLQPPSAIPDGQHALSATASDAFGNTSVLSDPVTVTIDATPPTVFDPSPANGSFTMNRTPTISASWTDATSGLDLATARITLDGVDVTAASTIAAAGFTHAPSAPLADGAHSVTTEVKDMAGNTGSLTWSFTVDLTPPTVLLEPADDTLTTDATPTFTAAYSDAGSGVDTATFKAFLDGEDVTASFVVGSASASFTPTTTIRDGFHVFAVQVSDRAGNLADVSSFFREVSAFGTLGASGGTLEVTDPMRDLYRASLMLSPSAVEEDALFVIAQEDLPAGFPTAFTPVGPAALFDPVNRLFSAPATITVPYLDALVAATGVPESQVKLFRYDQVIGTWTEVPVSAIDEGNNLLSAQVGDLIGNIFVAAVQVLDTARSDLSAAPTPLPADGITLSFITVTPRNAQGAPLGAGQDVSLQIVSGTGLLGGVLDLGDGTYRGVLISTTPGTVTVKAIVGGLDLNAQASVTFYAPEPAPSTLAVTAVTDPVQAGAAAELTLTVADSHGLPMKLFEGDVRIDLTGAVDAFGAARFPARIDARFTPFDQGVLVSALRFARAGEQSISATLLDHPTVTASRSDITVTSAPFQLLLKYSGDNQAALPNETLPLPFVAQTTDEFGNPVAGIAVTYQATQGGGSFAGGAATTSDGAGLATSPSFTVGSSLGVNLVEAAAPGAQAVFTAFATRPAPAISNLSSGAAVDGPRFTVTGSASEGGLTIRVLADGQIVGATVSAPDGSWSITVDVPPGAAELTTVSVDATGLVSLTSAPLSIVVNDAQGPVLGATANATILSLAATRFINDATPELAVTYADSSGILLSTLSVTLDGADITARMTVGPDKAVFQVPALEPLLDGLHALAASVEDALGHRSEATFVFSIDRDPAGIAMTPKNGATVVTIAPKITVVYRDPTTVAQGPSGPVQVEPSGVDPATVRIMLDGIDRTSEAAVSAQEAVLQITASSPLALGYHTLTVDLKDNAGNSSRRLSDFIVDPMAEDFELPTVRFIYPLESSIAKTAGRRLPVAVEADDNLGVDRVELYVDGVLAGVDATEPYLFEVTLPGVPLTSVLLQAKAIDVKGMTRTVDAQVELTEPPAAGAVEFAILSADTAIAGDPYATVIRALKADGQVDTTFTGSVLVRSSDASSSLFVEFEAADQGVKSVVLPPWTTAGFQALEAAQTEFGSPTGIRGARTGILVQPGPAVSIMVVSEPGIFQEFRAGNTLRYQVTARDAFGNIVTQDVLRLIVTETDAQGVQTVTEYNLLPGSPADALIPTGQNASNLKIVASLPENPGIAPSTTTDDLSARLRVNFAFETPVVEAGKPVSLTVFALDLNGNVMPDFEGTIYVHALEKFSGEKVVEGFPLALEFTKLDLGIKRVSEGLIVKTAGQIRFLGSTEDLGSATIEDQPSSMSLMKGNGVSNELTVLPGPAMKYESTAPFPILVGDLLSTQAVVRDAFDNPVFREPVKMTVDLVVSVPTGGAASMIPSPFATFKGPTDRNGTVSLLGPPLPTGTEKLIVKVFDALDVLKKTTEFLVTNRTQFRPITLTPSDPPTLHIDKTEQALPDISIDVGGKYIARTGGFFIEVGIIRLSGGIFTELDGTETLLGFTSGGADIVIPARISGTISLDDGALCSSSRVTLARTEVPGEPVGSNHIWIRYLLPEATIQVDNPNQPVPRPDDPPCFAYTGGLTFTPDAPVKYSNIQIDVPNTPEVFTAFPNSMLHYTDVTDIRLEAAFIEGTYAPRMVTLRQDVRDFHRAIEGISSANVGAHSWTNYGEPVYFEIRTREEVPVPEGETEPTITGVRLDCLKKDTMTTGGFVKFMEEDPVTMEQVQTPGTFVADLRLRKVQENVYRSDPYVVLDIPLVPPNPIRRPEGTLTVKAQSPVLSDGKSPAAVTAILRQPDGSPMKDATVEFSTSDDKVKFIDPTDPTEMMTVSGPLTAMTDANGEASVKVVSEEPGTRPVKGELKALPDLTTPSMVTDQTTAVFFVRGVRTLIGAFGGRLDVTVPKDQQPPPDPEAAPEDPPPPPVDVFEDSEAPMTTLCDFTRTHGVKLEFSSVRPMDMEKIVRPPGIVKGFAARIRKDNDILDVVAPRKMRYVYSDISEYGLDFNMNGKIEIDEVHIPLLMVDDGLLESSTETSLNPKNRRTEIKPPFPPLLPFPIRRLPQPGDPPPPEPGADLTGPCGSKYRIAAGDPQIVEWEIDPDRFKGSPGECLYEVPAFLPGPNRARLVFSDYLGNRAPVVFSTTVYMYGDEIPGLGTQFEFSDQLTTVSNAPPVLARYEIFFDESFTEDAINDFLFQHGLLPMAYDVRTRRLTVVSNNPSLTLAEYEQIQKDLDELSETRLVFFLPELTELYRTNLNRNDAPTVAQKGPAVQEAPRGTTPFGGAAGTVNLHNGEFVLVQEDLRIPGVGFDWHHTRTYRSQVFYEGPQGHGWDFNYNIRLGEHREAEKIALPFTLPSGEKTRMNKSTNGDVVLFDGTGRREVYVWVPQDDGITDKGGYYSPPGRYDTLFKRPKEDVPLTPDETEALTFGVAGGPDSAIADYAIMDRHRTIFRFRVIRAPDSRRVPEVDPNAGRNELSSHYSFKGLAQIWEIEDRNKNRMLFRYNTKESDGITERNPSDFNRLTDIVDTTNRHIGYRYDNDGTLKEIEAYVGGVGQNANRKLTFDYWKKDDSNGAFGNPKDLKIVRSPPVTLTSTGNNFPEGKATTYTYSTSTLASLRHNLLTVTDGNGNGDDGVFNGSRAFLKNTYGEENTKIEFDRVRLQTYGRADGSPEFIATKGDFHFKYELVAVSAGSEELRAKTTERNRRSLSENDPHRDEWTFLGQVINTDPTSLKTAKDSTPVFHREYEPEIADNIITEFKHNAGTELLKITFPKKNFTEFKFEDDNRPAGEAGRDRGNLRKETRDAAGIEGSTPSVLETEFTYDERYNFVETLIRPRGAAPDRKNNYTTSFDINPQNGNLRKITEPAPVLGFNTSQRQFATSQLKTHFLYTSNGHIESRINPDNTLDFFKYDDSGRYLLSVTRDTLGLALKTKFENDAVGNVIAAIDPRDVRTEFEVNALNQGVKVTRAKDRQIEQHYVETRFDYNDNVVRIREENTLGTVVSSLGGNAAYDRSFADTHGSDVSYFETTFLHDSLNNVISTTQGQGANSPTTRFEYDRNENRTTVITPKGTSNFIETKYNALDLPSEVSRSGFMKFRFKYDPNRNRIETIDGNTRSTEFKHDGYDRNIEVKDPTGTVAAIKYDAHGNVRRTTVTGPDGRDGSTTLRDVVLLYDNLDRLYATLQAMLDPNSPDKNVLSKQPTIDADDFKERISDSVSASARTLDAMGRAIALTNGNGNTLVQEFDTAGRLFGIQDPGGRTNTFTVDANGNTTRVVQSETGCSYAYLQRFDALNRMIETKDSGDHVRSYAYDARDALVSTVDGRGNRTNVYTDFLGRPVRTEVLNHSFITEGIGTTTAPNQFIRTDNAWDANSNLISQKDANGRRTDHVFDGADRRTATLYGLDGGPFTSEEYQDFDGNGNPQTLIDRRNVRFSIAYDALGRMTEIQALSQPTSPPPMVGTTRRTMRWDGLGRMTSAEDNNTLAVEGVLRDHPQSAKLFYNGLSQVIRDVQNHTELSGATRQFATLTAYDAAGNKVRTAYPSGKVVERSYHADEQLMSVGVPGSVQPLAATYSYFGQGRLRERRFGSGAVQSLGYDGDKQLSAMSYQFGRFQLSVAIPERDGEHNIATQVVQNSLMPEAATRNCLASYQEILFYDAAGRLKESRRDALPQEGGHCLVEAVFSSSAYDLAGNAERTRTAHRYLEDGRTRFSDTLQTRDVNALHQYTAINETRTFAPGAQVRSDTGFQYDGAGNLIWSGDFELRYDAFGRPAEAFMLRHTGEVQHQDVREIADSDGKFQFIENRANLHPGLFANGTLQFFYHENDTGFTKTVFYEVEDNGVGTVTFKQGAQIKPFSSRPRLIWAPFYILHLPSSAGPQLVACYLYDGLGRRTVKDVVLKGLASGIHHFAYEGMQILEDEVIRSGVEAGAHRNEYVWGRSIDECVRVDGWRSTTSSSIKYLFEGPSGQLYVSKGGGEEPGAEEELYDISSGGSVTIRNGQTGVPATLDSFRNAIVWQGHYLDFETGLYWARARYYSPALGRFIQTDPLGAFGNQGGNPYAFGDNNPIGNRDPSGMFLQKTPNWVVDALEIGGRIGGIIAGGAYFALWIVAPPVAAALLPVVLGAAAVGVTQSFLARREQGASISEAGAGIISDITGITALYAAFEGRDIITQYATRESPLERVLSFTEGTLALGTIYAGGRAIVRGRVFRSPKNTSKAADVAARAERTLPTPRVSDPKLINIVADLYKGTRGRNPIGTGSTADAIRSELATGLRTHGKFHSQKGMEYINALSNWLRKNPHASHRDRLVAESLKRDLKSALEGH